MRPILPSAPAEYDQETMQRVLNVLADVLMHCLRNDEDIRPKSPIRLTITDDDGVEWIVGIDTSGAIATSTYP